jgi:hypothetical protein
MNGLAGISCVKEGAFPGGTGNTVNLAGGGVAELAVLCGLTGSRGHAAID